MAKKVLRLKLNEDQEAEDQLQTSEKDTDLSNDNPKEQSEENKEVNLPKEDSEITPEIKEEDNNQSGFSENGDNRETEANEPEEVKEENIDPETQRILDKISLGEPSKIYINELKNLTITDLIIIAEYLDIENRESMQTQEIIYHILNRFSATKGSIHGGGTLQIIENNNNNNNSKPFGFLRSQRYNYLSSSDDIYVSPSQINRFKLKTGDVVTGQIREPKKNEGGEKFFALLRIEEVNGVQADKTKRRTLFDNLTPIFPDEAFDLEVGQKEIAMRMMSLFTPIGKGQRGLIVSPPKAGKTVLLKKLANSITTNHPEVKMLIFLVDERPEEVTDMKRSVDAEVISSTFDEPAYKHTQVANMVLEKAKRLVESGHDVVVLLDSITRLARAYNLIENTSGKVLSGGIDSNALFRPKKFFGAARNIEEGGSLTILATALVDTGSKMDEVIYEEFKGTGNMEIHLDRNLSNIRIFPAIDIKLSGTRREDLLMDKDNLEKVRMLRKVFAGMSNEEIITKMSQSFRKTNDNNEFLTNMQYFSNAGKKN